MHHVVGKKRWQRHAGSTDSPTSLEGRPHDCEHGAPLRSERSSRAGGRDTKPIEIIRDCDARCGTPKIDQPAIVDMCDERGNRPHSRGRRLGAPHAGVEALDEILIDPRAGRVRAEQGGPDIDGWWPLRRSHSAGVVRVGTIGIV